jgi:hypothetical protein
MLRPSADHKAQATVSTEFKLPVRWRDKQFLNHEQTERWVVPKSSISVNPVMTTVPACCW